MAEQKEFLEGIVDKFHAAGYQIWMDDFGSAYSSLNSLKELTFDEIKLDMRFLRPFNLRSKRITTYMVAMAKSIGIHTLVEGVETEEQFSYMHDIGCEKVQGYYFGEPLPYEEALANLKVKNIPIEAPQDRLYYDEIGRIDFLSAVPFMTQKEQDAIVTARQLNSIPLALAEFSLDTFTILFCNTAFEETAAGTGMFQDVFSQEMLRCPQPYNRISDKLVQLMDYVKKKGDGRMMFTFNEQYFEIRARRMAQTKGRFCVLIKVTNLTKESKAENTSYLDDVVRRIYAIFDRITLINVKEDTIRPLYTASSEDLVSGRRGIKALLLEYAERYIYSEDRERYIHTYDPEVMFARFATSPSTSFTEVFRTSLTNRQYGWNAYTVLKIDEENYLMLVRNVHKTASELVERLVPPEEDDGTISPTRLWNALIHSDLLGLFWKDKDRRFLGVSQAFLDYYGFSSTDDVRGKTDEDLGWHVHPDLYMNDEYQVIKNGITIKNKSGFCMRDGENREIAASKMPLYNWNGEIAGLLGFFIDKGLLNANDKFGPDSSRRDMLTGLLNSRGLSEEAALFYDEFYLRGTDFVRIHIAVNDFAALNEQYGFDFGDKVLNRLGEALRKKFGLTSAVGRYSGNNFVVLHQIQTREEANNLRAMIKEVGTSLGKVEGVPVTLYLSVGYVLFSECQDTEEQARLSEMRLHADYDQNISNESRLVHATEIFYLFDDLPMSYSVYRVRRMENSNLYDAEIFYVNHRFEEFGGVQAKDVLGRSVREIFPHLGEGWYRDVRRAAWDGETVEGYFVDIRNGRRFQFTARQIIYRGYCAVTYLEV